MDTKSTKFKTSLTAKILCIFLSALMFFSFIYSTVIIFAGINLYGTQDFFTNKKPYFFETYAFGQVICSDAYLLYSMTENTTSNVDAAFDSNQNTIINEAVNKYLDEKAEIIRNELSYAVENYDESYFMYEYVADLIDTPEESSSDTSDIPSASKQETVTAADGTKIPKNIETAIKVLENCQGQEFLKYEILVRSSAFTEGVFTYNSDIPYTQDNFLYFDFSCDYTLSETEIKNELISQFNGVRNNYVNDHNESVNYAVNRISEHQSLKYYCIDTNGNIHTNVSNITTEQFINKASKNKFYVFSENGKRTFSGCTDYLKAEISNNIFSDSSGVDIYFYIDDAALESYEDLYSSLHFIHTKLNRINNAVPVIAAILFFIASAILFVALVLISGYKNGVEGCITTKRDKIPADIHFLLVSGSIAAIISAGLYAIFECANNSTHSKLLIYYSPVIISALMTVIFLIFTSWIISLSRIRKSGQKIGKTLLIRNVAVASADKLKKLISKLVKVFGYKPGQIQKTTIFAVVAYLSGNILIFIISRFASMVIYSGICIFFGAVATIIYNTVCLYFALQYLKNLDRIIDASCRHETVDFGKEKLPESLKILSSNLTNTNEALEKAIEKAIRDEQMKTELITNVSHDLKTPLTSLISYSDLLSKCDVKDENAVKYISVINNQSIKLKRLIEDLIEASKVSTGNVTINKSKLNLSELTMQVIAEFAPEMEKNGNEIIFSESENPPSVMADGAKTYRILANLLSNAKKYSMPDTRVYISVYTDNINSYFEIKNISSEPLNIRPEELTERFVRGDKSRSREGNGLGLSIAKDLCELQGGEIHLHIDGDLFKAIVRLPSAGAISADTTETE